MTHAIPGWEDLRHGGLLLDGTRLHALADRVQGPLPWHVEQNLRQSEIVRLETNLLGERTRTSMAPHGRSHREAPGSASARLIARAEYNIVRVSTDHSNVPIEADCPTDSHTVVTVLG